MSSLVGGTGIIGQDMVCGFGNGKYKTFEGTEISIENCVKAKIKDLVVEGKTYQNLVDINSYQNVTGINLVDNKVEYQTTETQSVGVINPISIKSNTKYTLITDILDINDYEKPYIIRVTDENNKWSLNLGSINANTIGKKFLVFTTPSDLTYFKILLYNSSFYAGIKFTFPILLEGEYTNTDIPNSINGIESVTEKENNILSVKINDNTTTLHPPIPLRSLPNGVADTIEGNTLVQRVGRVVLDGNEDWKLQSCNVKGNGILNIFFIIQDLIIKLKEKQFIICDKYIQQKTPIADTTNEGVLVNEEKRLYLRLFTSKATTVEKAKEYIKGNPFVVYYELAEPIIHDLRIPPIQTVKGTNIITTDNNIKPKLSMKVKVKK